MRKLSLRAICVEAQVPSALVVGIVLITLFLLLVSPVSMLLGKSTARLPAWASSLPLSNPSINISRTYVIQSYWSKERAHLAEGVCQRVRSLGIECFTWPGIYLKGLDEQQQHTFLQQNPIASSIVRISLKEWVLWLLGKDEEKNLVRPSGKPPRLGNIGNTLAHVNVLRNWTHGTLQPSNLPRDSQIMIVEDDVFIPDNLTTVLAQLKLPSDWGLLNMYNYVGACRHSFLHKWVARSGGQGVYQASVGFSRTTAVVYTYRGAEAIVKSLPFAEIVDMWYRRLMWRRVLKIMVACPDLVGLTAEAANSTRVRRSLRGALCHH